MNVDIQPPRENHPNWALAQKDAFLLSQKGQHPPFNTEPEELERQAKESLSKGGWLYASCNAGINWTHRANREGEWCSRRVPIARSNWPCADLTTSFLQVSRGP